MLPELGDKDYIINQEFNFFLNEIGAFLQHFADFTLF